MVAENEKDGIISQEEVGEAKDILKLKVQRSSLDMLKALQWAGGIWYIYKYISYFLFDKRRKVWEMICFFLFQRTVFSLLLWWLDVLSMRQPHSSSSWSLSEKVFWYITDKMYSNIYVSQITFQSIMFYAFDVKCSPKWYGTFLGGHNVHFQINLTVQFPSWHHATIGELLFRF